MGAGAMELYRTDPNNTEDAVGGYRMDEHVDSAAGHVFIEPKDDLGRRVEPAVFRLG
jgi:hypothetical protein